LRALTGRLACFAGVSENPDPQRPSRRSSPAALSDHPSLADAAGGPAPAARFVGPLESVLRHPLLTLIPLLVLVAIALAVGLTRDPEYTAEAGVSVGRVDVPAFTLQGVVQGNATLAAGYARAIAAEPVVVAAAREANLTPRSARARLDASPVPGSTLIRIEGRRTSEAGAVTLANAGARSLITYIVDLEARQQETGLLAEYRRSREIVDEARRRFRRFTLEDRRDSERVREARVDLELARLRTSTLRNRIRFGTSDEGVTRNVLQLLTPAAEADSDRGSVLQRLLLIAVAAGAVLGAVLALLRSNRGLLRRRRT
jgi:uncharacterized protein involved in exopolysaccharide biosynthesis